MYELTIEEDNKWAGLSIMEADIPEDILVVMIKRGKNVIIPKGSTILKCNDIIVLSGNNILDIINK